MATASPARTGLRPRVATIVKHATLAVAVFVSLAPFLWLLSIALRPVEQTYVVPMPLIPTKLTLEHFVSMSAMVPMMTVYYRNSFVITGVSVAAIVAIACLSGYAFARLRFPGREPIFWTVVTTMFLPSMMAVPALYVLLSQLDLLNTLPGLILPYTGW